MPATIKILFLADTHLGFDFPLKPRVQRRRRGFDFFKIYHLVLQHARTNNINLIIHGGDMFFRSRVHPEIVSKGFAPLIEIAEHGIPVFIVPGNHERSWIPASIFDTHPRIHIFEKPKTYFLSVENIRLAVAGFPYQRQSIRQKIKNVIQQTGYQAEASDARLLCMHQIFEGARVGIQNYMFRYGVDVIQGKDIPADFLAVLTGHIHRSQVLKTDLFGNLLNVPILYPGAIERTSFVERDEKKGFLTVDISFFGDSKQPRLKWKFEELPARPMHVITVNQNSDCEGELKFSLADQIHRLNKNAVVKVKLIGESKNSQPSSLSADWLRSVAPATMNIEFSGFEKR